MATYSTADFARIAETIAKRPAQVRQYTSHFEAAATWYRSYCRVPKGIHLAETAKRARQISNAAKSSPSSRDGQRKIKLAHGVPLHTRQLMGIRV